MLNGSTQITLKLFYMGLFFVFCLVVYAALLVWFFFIFSLEDILHIWRRHNSIEKLQIKVYTRHYVLRIVWDPYLVTPCIIQGLGFLVLSEELFKSSRRLQIARDTEDIF